MLDNISFYIALTLLIFLSHYLYVTAFVINLYSKYSIFDVKAIAESYINKDNRKFNKNRVSNILTSIITVFFSSSFVFLLYFIISLLFYFVLLIYLNNEMLAAIIMIFCLFFWRWSIYTKIRVNLDRLFLFFNSDEKEMNTYKSSPVLCLRAFEDDNEKTGLFDYYSLDDGFVYSKLELYIKNIFKKSNPFIAIVNPKEKFQNQEQ